MRWISRLRMLLGYRPWLYWICVGAIALTVAAAIEGSQATAHRTRDRWGTASAVLVASRAIAPGERLDGAVVRRSRPSAMVPTTALELLPTGATARQYIAAGEMVTRVDIAAATGPLALLPQGWLAIAISDQHPELFSVGDTAAVLSSGEILSDRAVVVGTADNVILVGVPTTSAAAVANAANQHLAMVALSASHTPQ